VTFSDVSHVRVRDSRARDEREIGMVLRRKLALMAAAVLGVGAGVVGVGAVSSGADQGGAPEVAGVAVDDADERVRGGEAERAERAAVEAVGGGRVVGVEREDEPGVAWEVEVVGRDGGEVEVELGASLERVAVDRGDDGAEDEREDADDDASEEREGDED
jgi:hypothetical protein